MTKRKKMRAEKGCVYIDNDEIISSFRKEKKYYFIRGKTPFADFSVLEYLSYVKSLELRRPLKRDEAEAMLLKTGIRINTCRKMGSLDIVTQRFVRLSATLKEDVSKVYINFDGLKFSRAAREKICKIVSALSGFEVAISVSDIRFVPPYGATQWFFCGEVFAYTAKVIRRGRRACCP